MSPPYILPSVTRSLPCHAAVRLVPYIDLSRSCHAAVNAFSLSCLRSQSPYKADDTVWRYSLTIQSDNSPSHGWAEVHVTVDTEIFECANLKFTASGQSKQANKQASIHTHMRNAVMLAWGSLRLAPIRPKQISVYPLEDHIAGLEVTLLWWHHLIQGDWWISKVYQSFTYHNFWLEWMNAWIIVNKELSDFITSLLFS